MVQYKCKNCKKIFNKKSNYENHINRKNPCQFSEKAPKLPVIKCNYCKKQYSRRDVCNKHQKTCKQFIKETNIKQKMGNKNQVINGENGVINYKNKITNNISIINHNYNLVPFGKEGIDHLDDEDKISIFCSKDNPMVKIILKTNLDPKKIYYHNVGILDLHSANGSIFDGKKWVSEKNDIIVEKLLNSKEADLLEVHDDIREQFSDKKNKTIENKLVELAHTIRPSTESQIKLKKKLMASLKTSLYNHRDLAISAKKMTDQLRTITENIDEEIVVENIESESRISLLKELSNTLLEESKEAKNITNHHYNMLLSRITETKDIELLNLIITSLISSAYFNNKITNFSIDDKIDKLKEFDTL
jgi:hypothetical protein